MAQLTTQPVPADSLLARRIRPGDYADCFVVVVDSTVSLGEFITAFYSSAAFRTERTALALLGRYATAEDIAALAQGQTDSFAAWDVEERTNDQLLMQDFLGKTRSWLSVEPVAGRDATVLRFGSWVGAKAERDGAVTGNRLSLITNLAYPFHRAYSRLLLAGAVRHLAR